MTGGIKKIALAAAVGLLVLLACVLLGLIPVNLFFAKPAITGAVQEHLGLTLEIEGPLRARLGFRPSLSAADIRVGLKPSSPTEELRIASLKAGTRLTSLLSGELELTRLSLRGLDPGAMAGIDRRLLPTDLALEAAAPRDGPLTAEMSGRLRDEPIRLSVRGDRLSLLLTDPDSYPVEASLNAPSTVLRIEGVLRNPLSDPTLESSVRLEALDLEALTALLGQQGPPISSLAFDSQLLAGRSGIRLDGLDGELDGIPLRLSGSLRNLESRPRIEVTAEFPRLDASRWRKDGHAAGDRGGTNSFELRPVFDFLSAFDGRASLRGDGLANLPPGFEADDISIDLSLDQGVLTVERASFSAAGSEVSANARLDTAPACAPLLFHLDVRAFDLATLSHWLEGGVLAGGVLEELQLDFASCGDTIDAHLRSLETRFQARGLTPHLEGEALPLSLSSLEGRLAAHAPGGISFQGELSGEPLTVSATFGAVTDVLSNRASNFTFTALGGGSRLSAEGFLGLLESGPALDLVLDAEAGRLGDLHAWLGTAPENSLPFQARAQIRLDGRGLAVDGLSATLGRSDVAGRFNWPAPGSGTPAAVSLAASHMDLVEIAGLFPESHAQEKGAAQDWIEILENSEWAGRWSSLPLIDVNLSVDSFHGLLEDAGDLRLGARLQERAIREGQLTFRMEGIDFAGTLDADFSARPWVVDFESTLNNVDIGRLLASLELRDDVTARADRVNIRVNGRGNTPRELVMNGRMDSKIESLFWSLEGGPDQRKFDVSLSELEVVMRPDSDTVWRTHGELNGSPISALVRTPSIHRTFDPSLSLPVRLVLDSPDDVIMLDMEIDPASDDGIGARLAISGSFGGSRGVDLADLESPLDDYAFEVRARTRPGEFVKTEFEGQIGSSRAGGRVDVFALADGLRFEVDLDSPFLETEDLVNWAEEFRTAHRAIADDGPAEQPGNRTNAGLLVLLDEYVREYSGRDEIHVLLRVDELRSSGRLFGKMDMELNMAGNDLRIEPLTIALPGGNVDVSYHTAGFGAQGLYELDVDIDNLAYGGLLRLLDPESTAEGELFLDIDLASQAAEAGTVVQNLSGQVDLAVFPVDVQAGFLDLWASNLIFALLSTGDDPDKKLNCLVARFEVEDGVMQTTNAFLDSTGVIVRARGDIDLGRRQLDLLVAPQSKREKFLSVSTPIAVTGPFEDFRVEVAPGGFIRTMVRWYYGLIYVPWKWLTGERFPADGIATCHRAMGWDAD